MTLKKHLFTSLFIIVTSWSTFSQTQLSNTFFDNADTFFKKYVVGSSIKYNDIKSGKDLETIINQVENINLSSATNLEKKAFYINAYNLSVINQAISNYPLVSVKDINGFFDSKKVIIAGESTTLNDFEKDKLLAATGDARLHFVLVCGANGCPPIINKAYRPETLDEQLTNQTTIALNNPTFLKVDGDKVEISQIFNWYASDFGKSRENILAFINTYRKNKLPIDTKLKYYTYDWILNDYTSNLNSADPDKPLGNNAIRYVVSSTIPVGSNELKIFNNLYTQAVGSRSNFFTTSFSYLHGVKRRLNLGVAARYRRVRNDTEDSSPFAVLGKEGDAEARQGFTYLGPQVRWAPVEKWGNFSIQSQFLIPLGKDQTGFKTGKQYIDYSRPTWLTQFFNDKSLGTNFSIFTEIDASFEGIGIKEEAGNRVTFPITAILSYFPHPKFTIYGLTNYTPAVAIPYDYFYQVGSGAKYQITRKFELELLYTVFRNKFIIENGGTASTFNMGIRASF